MTLSFLYPQFLWLLLLVPFTFLLGSSGPRSQASRRLQLSLALRSLLITLIVLALAGIQLALPEDKLTTVFLLDVSDSIPAAEQERGKQLIRQAIQTKPPEDEAAIILFGQDALIERLASKDEVLPELASTPITMRTDIAGALQLAQAILPAEGAKRLVLLSDGRENLRHAMEQAELAAAQGIELTFVPLGGPPGEQEVWVENLQAPSEVRQGEDFELTVVVQSSVNTAAALRLFRDQQLIASREVRLLVGENRFSLPVSATTDDATQGGFQRFRVQILPDADTRLQNNEASAFTIVHGPPRVLIVEGSPGEAQNLAAALQAAEIQTRLVAPAQTPVTLAELAGYEAVILVNVPASRLPDGAMQALPLLVRDLGKGLLMVGGETSFGAGGYLRTPLEAALPVSMDVRDREFQANLALVLAVDKSGSMGRCHCDNPDLNQTYTRAEVGLPKVDIAKEAIIRAASALGEQDYLGVVAFDAQAHWALKLAPLTDPAAIERAIGSFNAEGGTNLVSGVQAAYQALQSVEARRKHIILLTDGWVRTGDLTALAAQMKEQGITLSVVAAGEGSAEYLASLAVTGGGVYYPARDMLSVPEIFLKETIQSVGEYLIEEPFYPLPAVPSPILRGIDPAQLPPLLGYNGTTARRTARLDLLTPRGDPLLATWQYGLGRAAIWASDFKGQWAKEWLNWSDFPRFAAQLVSWLLPAPRVEGLEASLTLQDNQALITLQARGKDGQPLNFLDVQATIVDPELQTQQTALKQTSAGGYQSQFELRKPGVYLVRLGANQEDQSLGQLTLGLVVPYSPEYKTSGIALGFLEQLAQITGGGQLRGSAFDRSPNLRSESAVRPIGQTLLLLAALLFPLDVAVRRVILQRRDLQRLWQLLRRLRSGRQVGAEAEPPLLADLFRARERARRRTASTAVQRPAPAPPPTPPPAQEAPPAPPGQPQPPQSPEEALQRLRRAKERARKGR